MSTATDGLRKREVKTEDDGDAEPILAEAAEAVKELYAEFNEWQLKWYRGVMKKTILWSTLYISLLVAGLWYMEEPSSVMPFNPLETWRVILTLLGAYFSWATIYLDLYRATPPEENDTKKLLLEKNFNGHFSYLTFYIIFSSLLYWNACLVAEMAWYWGYVHHEEVPWARKILKLSYAASPLIAALGVTLAILFLKFNWFEASWRKEVLDLYHSRGHKWFGRNILFTHLNQTPLALLDMSLVKNRDMLMSSLPSFQSFSIGILLFGLVYIGSTHMNFSLSGQYPYPFFRKVLGTSWTLEITFVSAIIVFFHVMTFLMYIIATGEAPPVF